MGCLMENGIATYSSLSRECYVLQINGRVNSTHQCFQDALRAGLQLKYEFPHDNIKLREITSEEMTQETCIDLASETHLHVESQDPVIAARVHLAQKRTFR